MQEWRIQPGNEGDAFNFVLKMEDETDEGSPDQIARVMLLVGSETAVACVILSSPPIANIGC
jgi:hypothetical protein